MVQSVHTSGQPRGAVSTHERPSAQAAHAQGVGHDETSVCICRCGYSCIARTRQLQYGAIQLPHGAIQLLHGARQLPHGAMQKQMAKTNATVTAKTNATVTAKTKATVAVKNSTHLCGDAS